MAGIGVRLNRIFNKNTLTSNIFGFGYSVIVTIAPMLLVIGAIVITQYVLGVSKLGYANRELFAATVLYILPEALRQFSDYRMLVYAIVLIIVMLATNNPTLKGLAERLLRRGEDDEPDARGGAKK